MMPSLRELHSDLHRSEEEREGRVSGVVVGKITNVSDPQGLGRIKARYGAQDNNEESDWLLPMWPGSMEFIPRKDDMVGIVFLDGDPHRGFYSWHPTSNTKNRPTEAAVLGSTMAAMYNDLVAKFNNLKSKYNAHGHKGSVTVCANGAPWTGISDTPVDAVLIPPVHDTDADAGKMQAADGSTVSAQAADSKALSGNVKVGK